MWPTDSDVRGKDLDISKPFTLDDKTSPPLPGMKLGYFQGSMPHCGAVQFGETATQAAK